MERRELQYRVYLVVVVVVLGHFSRPGLFKTICFHHAAAIVSIVLSYCVHLYHVQCGRVVVNVLFYQNIARQMGSGVCGFSQKAELIGFESNSVVVSFAPQIARPWFTSNQCICIGTLKAVVVQCTVFFYSTVQRV